MRILELEVFSERTNCPILRLPGRTFPGVLIQGDSLNIMRCLAREIARLGASASSTTISDTANELLELLNGYSSEYESVMNAHKHALPYSPTTD